jgi:hypothetical protein
MTYPKSALGRIIRLPVAAVLQHARRIGGVLDDMLAAGADLPQCVRLDRQRGLAVP